MNRNEATSLIQRLGIFLCLLAVGSVGCLSPSPPANPRYFLPNLEVTPPATDGTSSPASIRLNRVLSAPHLRENLVWRVSDVEIGLDDMHRWGAPPADLVELSLRKALYQNRRFQDSSQGPTLQIHLLAFEARYEQQDAYVEWMASLRWDRENVETQTFRSSTKVGLSGASVPNRQEVTALVQALGQSLSETALSTAAWIEQQGNER